MKILDDKVRTSSFFIERRFIEFRVMVWVMGNGSEVSATGMVSVGVSHAVNEKTELAAKSSFAKMVDKFCSAVSLPNPKKMLPPFLRPKELTPEQIENKKRTKELRKHFLNVKQLRDDHIVRGSRPRDKTDISAPGCTYTPDHARLLHDLGVNLVINLYEGNVSDQSIENLLEQGIELMRFSTKDYTSPSTQTLRQIAEIIKDNQAHGETYIHCGAGRGRTGTVITAYQIISGQIRSKKQLQHAIYENKVEAQPQQQTLARLLRQEMNS